MKSLKCLSICIINLFICNHLIGQNYWNERHLFNNVTGPLSLFGGLNLSKQDIEINHYTSKFNYSREKFQNNLYKPGYFIGLRLDGSNESENNFDLSFSFHQYNSGTNYLDTPHLTPFMGSFTNYKADDKLAVLNLSTNYKRLLNNHSTANSSLYFIIGPSIDFRLSDQTSDNQIQHNYKKIAAYANIGIEFNNQSYYSLFIHYKQAINSLTNNTIVTKLSVFELGTVFKLSDIF